MEKGMNSALFTARATPCGGCAASGSRWVPRLCSSAGGLFWVSASTLTFLIFLTCVRCLPCQLGVRATVLAESHSEASFPVAAAGLVWRLSEGSGSVPHNTQQPLRLGLWVLLVLTVAALRSRAPLSMLLHWTKSPKSRKSQSSIYACDFCYFVGFSEGRQACRPSVQRWEVLCGGSCYLCVRLRREQFAVLVRIPVGLEDRSNRTGLLLSSVSSCPRRQFRSHASVLPA
jgi:hypothetical protein